MKNQIDDISATAIRLFSGAGTKATSMDEIAHRCGLSKKTLYTHFSSKDSLVEEVIRQLVAKTEQHMRVWPDISPNAISEMLNCFHYMQDILTVLSPLFLKDVERFHSSSYQLLIRSGRQKFIPFISRNIERGIAEGLYRSEINSELAGKWYFWQLRNVLVEPFLPAADRQKVFSYTNGLFLQAMTNAAGGNIVIAKMF